MSIFTSYFKKGSDPFTQLEQHGVQDDEISAMKTYVHQAQDRELYLANPRFLAKKLDMAENRAIDVLTLAAYENLWQLVWETYCSSCSMFLESADTLADIRLDYTCPYCQNEDVIHLDEEVVLRVTLKKEVRVLDPTRRDDPNFRAEIDNQYGPLKALQIINRKIFREILGERNLPANNSLGVQHLAVFFSDLKASTAMYQRLGDVQAYEIVRKHFNIVFSTVEKYAGSAVKTIGDGVMSTFLDNASALKSAMECIRSLQTLNDEYNLMGDDRLRLKIGLHAGPCIVVTMDHRLDYFGSTVNVASRLSSLAEGDDILFSRDVLAQDEAFQVAQKLGYITGQREYIKGFPEPMRLLCLDFDEE
jgi:class 3 adenylate cyclase